MNEPIKFVGALEGARVDGDGEWTLTIKVPLACGPQVAALALHQEVALDFSVLPQEADSKHKL